LSSPSLRDASSLPRSIAAFASALLVSTAIGVPLARK
jgi:hypothetical protein